MRRTDRLSGVAGVSLVLLIVVVSHALLATIYTPVHSDVDTYRDYAAAVSRGIADGTSSSVARDATVREQAETDGVVELGEDAFLVEYPPLAVYWMALPGIGLDLNAGVGAQRDEYAARFRLAMFAVDLVVIVLLGAWAARSFLSREDDLGDAWRLAFFGISTLILGNLLFDRLDFVVAALLLASATLLVRGWWPVAYLLLALAINFKASPIALAPLWVLASLPVRLYVEWSASRVPLLKAAVVRSVALAAVSMLVFLPFVILEGSRALDFLRFRAIQGVHIESIPGSLILLLGKVGLPAEVTLALGTFEVGSPLSSFLATVSPLLLVVVAGVVVWLYARAATRRRDPALQTDPTRQSAADVRPLATADPQLFLIATVATLMLTLVTSKLLSPQYLFCVLPMVAIIQFSDGRTRSYQVWFLATCAVTTVIFPYLLGRTLARLDPATGLYLEPTWLGVALIVVRNLLLLWMAWLAIRELLRRADRPGRVARATNHASATLEPSD